MAAREQHSAGSWFSLAVLIAVISFGIFDRQTLYLMAAPIALSLKLSDAQLGMVKGLGSAVFSMIAIYPLGWLGDRVGRRLTLLICVTIWGAGTAACGFAMSYQQFFMAAVAIAAAESGLGPLTVSAVPELFPGTRRATANAVYTAGLALGGSCSLLLIGVASAWVETVHNGLPAWFQGLDTWRVMFLLAAAPTPIFLVLMAMTKLGRRRKYSATSHGQAYTPRFWPFLRANGGRLSLVLGALLICGIGSDIGHAWIAIALARLFGASPATNGFGLGIAAAVGAVASILITGPSMRLVQRRLGPRAPFRVIIVAMAVLAIPATLMVFINAPWQAFTLEALQLTIGAMFAALSAYLMQDLAPDGLRGQLFAVNSVVSKPFAGLGITLVGFVSDRLPGNPRSVLIAAAIVAIACLTLGCVLMALAEKPYLRLRESLAAVPLGA